MQLLSQSPVSIELKSDLICMSLYFLSLTHIDCCLRRDRCPNLSSRCGSAMLNLPYIVRGRIMLNIKYLSMLYMVSETMADAILTVNDTFQQYKWIYTKLQQVVFASDNCLFTMRNSFYQTQSVNTCFMKHHIHRSYIKAWK